MGTIGCPIGARWRHLQRPPDRTDAVGQRRMSAALAHGAHHRLGAGAAHLGQRVEAGGLQLRNQPRPDLRRCQQMRSIIG